MNPHSGGEPDVHALRLAAFAALIAGDFKPFPLAHAALEPSFSGRDADEVTGTEADPSLRMLGSASIGGVLHHVEAYRVDRNGDEQVFLAWPDEALADAWLEISSYACPNGPVSTVTLADAEYAIFVVPGER
jgi:hypothetical protein